MVFLADKLASLKVNAEELAELLAKKLDAKGIAFDVGDQLLPELHKVVEEVARKFAARLDGQEDISELAKRLADCVALLLKLKQPDTCEVAGAVVDKSRGLLATLKRGLDALTLAVEGGLDTLTGMVQGLSSKVDSQSTQDAKERAEDRAKRGELGNEVQQPQATANEVQGAAQRIEAKADQLQPKADELGNKVQGLGATTKAQHRESKRLFLAAIGTMVVRFRRRRTSVRAC